MKTVIAFASVLLVGASAHAQTSSVSAAACERLAASLKLPNSTVTSATAVAAGKFVPPGGGGAAAAAGLPAFCRVALTIKPSSDSDIKSEVWLPMSGWNGKFLQVGNGAWGGSIQYGPLGDGLRRGYAAASTDTGHTGADASFAVGHPEKLIDFGYRSVHETAVQGKATVAALYGTAPRLSYFNGCSGGGRMSFMEAQRFPEDFDGIIAGAPGYNRTDGAFQSLGAMQATHKDPASFIPASKYPMLHKAALDKCDAVDGLKDGLITDPRSCKFDPAVLACKGADGPSCLTAPQVAAAQKIYAPVDRSEDRQGGVRGSRAWQRDALGRDLRRTAAPDVLRPRAVPRLPGPEVGLPEPRHQQAPRARAEEGRRHPDGDVTDLKPFVGRGGKLLIYHGWEDQNISPRMSVEYYEKVRRDDGQGVRWTTRSSCSWCPAWATAVAATARTSST